MSQSIPKTSSGEFTVAVIGASGFVGRAVMKSLVAAGYHAIPISAVRLTSRAKSVEELLVEAGAVSPNRIRGLASAGRLADVAINAAGLALPGAPEGEHLTGANALLPAVLARVALAAGWNRVVHLSSAAVYGLGRLAEDSEPRPRSPYGRSKLLGELALAEICDSTAVEPVILRPTSVHSPDRAVTRTLTRIARSRLASVAGPGDRPTPQVNVANVAAAAVFLATCSEPPKRPVLQPWEGATTAGLIRSIGDREPFHIPMPVARLLIVMARQAGRMSPLIGSEARRLEMLWFGQSQTAGWLDAAGWTPPYHWAGGFIQGT